MKPFNMVTEERVELGMYFAIQIFRNGSQNSSFYTVRNEGEKIEGFNRYRNSPEGYNYEGIMKIEDDEIYIDTFDIDINKYNL